MYNVYRVSYEDSSIWNNSHVDNGNRFVFVRLILLWVYINVLIKNLKTLFFI